jgi:GDP-L-fucose synthase
MFFKGKKVLVTGAAGLIGTNLIIALLKQGSLIRGTIHKKQGNINDPKIEYISADLTQRADCQRAVKGIDFVFHTAANTSGAVVMRNNPIVHITENVIMNSLLLEEACHGKVERFQFLSTTTVYPGVEHPVKEEEAYLGDPYETYFGVGWMKRYVEKLCAFYHRRFGMKISILRPTNVYGPYDKFDFETSHVLPALIRRAIEKQNPFEVWGDGTAVRDFIFVDDMVQVMLLAMEKIVDASAVNFGCGKSITIKEAVELILKLTEQRSVEIKFDPSKPTTIPVRRVDLTLCKNLLNYEAKTPFEAGLKQTIDWYRMNSFGS